MAISGRGKVAIVTGASSGIGEATAIALAEAGFRLALGARRVEKLSQVAARIERISGEKPLALALDVTCTENVETYVQNVLQRFGKVHVLVNNAGKALGRDPIDEVANEADWQEMIDTNVMGLLRMTRRLVPHLIASGEGHIVNIGSTAGHEAYAGGGVYCGTKFAVRAITGALRQELLGKPVRVTSIDPGMVETEFSIVRFHGDKSRADAVYAGMRPLTATDIADCIAFAVTRPVHVNIDDMIVTSIDQAGATRVVRRDGGQ
ncbi:NADP-dependent 3-hydroxy acid dehydrogenase YdfG [Alicyclobacillus sacchari]|uniref:NADP-dependent 3-hydroxy acid dehydrogenase YdfG n=1 Tax=Alicyclobacillus sacchari TaxID=392010 RepID=A0A4R8LQ47_9BACL|nr:SDR family NAD(P)-dependent oxidoreductase [Alicyclobacillus sacchari]TDY49604.1 NADP-dependent 3-hydroxy acid dehydrogenase YdfG [Alicyclobacillus sacchari]